MKTREQLADDYDRAFWTEYGAREVLRGLPVAAQNQAQPLVQQLTQAKDTAFAALYDTQRANLATLSR